MRDKLIVLLVVLAALVLPVGFKLRALSNNSDYLSYDDFIRAAEAGHIKAVTLDKFSSINGTQVVGGVEKPFHSYAETGAANDPLLLRFLGEKSVKITVSNGREEKPWGTEFFWLPLLMFGVPLITLVFVVLIYRRIRRAQPPATT